MHRTGVDVGEGYGGRGRTAPGIGYGDVVSARSEARLIFSSRVEAGATYRSPRVGEWPGTAVYRQVNGTIAVHRRTGTGRASRIGTGGAQGEGCWLGDGGR